jgi:hypothetical protein
MAVYNLYFNIRYKYENGKDRKPTEFVKFVLSKSSPGKGREFSRIEEIVRYAKIPKNEVESINTDPMISLRLRRKGYTNIHFTDAANLERYLLMSMEEFEAELVKRRENKKGHRY